MVTIPIQRNEHDSRKKIRKNNSIPPNNPFIYKKIPLINFVSFIFCFTPFILLLFSINNWINCRMVVENDTTLTFFSFHLDENGILS